MNAKSDTPNYKGTVQLLLVVLQCDYFVFPAAIFDGLAGLILDKSKCDSFIPYAVKDLQFWPFFTSWSPKRVVGFTTTKYFYIVFALIFDLLKGGRFKMFSLKNFLTYDVEASKTPSGKIWFSPCIFLRLL